MKKRYIFTSLLVALLLSACGTDDKKSSNLSSSSSLNSSSSTTNPSQESSTSTLSSSTSSSSTTSADSSASSSSIVQEEKNLTNIDELLDFIESFSNKEVEEISNVEYEKEYIYYSGYTENYKESGSVVAYDDNHIVNSYTKIKSDEWSSPITTDLQQYLGLYEEKPNYFYDILIDSSEPKPFMNRYELVDIVTNENTQIAKTDVNKKISLNIFSSFKEFINDAVVASNGIVKKQGNTILLETTIYTTSNELDSSHDNQLECSFQFELDNNDYITTLTYYFKEQEYQIYQELYKDIAYYSYSYEFSYGAKADAAESAINPGMFVATSFDLQLETSSSYYYEEVEPNALVAGNKLRGVAKNVVPSTAIDVDLTIQFSSNETIVDLNGNIKKSGQSHLVFVSTGGITKEVDVIVSAPAATYIYISLKSSSETYNLNDTVEFEIGYTPEETDDTFTVSVTAPNETVQTLQPNKDGKYSFVVTQKGKYVINVQDDDVESVSATKEIDVVEPLSDEDLKRLLVTGNGFVCEIYEYDADSYDYVDVTYTLKFNVDGTATITASKSNYWSATPTVSQIASFTYKIENGKIVLIFPLTIQGDEYVSGTITFQIGYDSNNETIISSIKFDLEASGYGYFYKTFEREA